MSKRKLVLYGDEDVVLAVYELPRVTHIIDTVLSKPSLPPYYFKQALEGVAKLGEVYGDNLPLDAPSMRQLLVQHKLDPWSVRDTAADRGTKVHSYLENRVQNATAPPLQGSGFPEHDAAIEGWLGESGAHPWLTEAVLTSFAGGYTGTADLVEPGVVIGDLKTSSGTYWSHHLQLEAYRQAWNEQHPEEAVPEGATFLLWVKPGINKKGFRVLPGKASPSDWQAVLAVYHSLQRKGVNL